MSVTNHWIRAAGVLGASAVTLGAIGAHAIKSKSDVMKDIWKTASLYHMIHSCILAVSASTLVGRKRNIVCGLLFTGTVIFCGSLYTVVLMNDRNPYGKPAPIGGLMMIGGWLAFGFL